MKGEIETRHLIALQAVADEGGFAAAADALGYSQAAISQQIGGLEKVIGMPVFDRPGGPRPATLTPAGRIVLRHGRLVLSRLDAIAQDLRLLQSGTGGRVVCGTFQSITVALLPDLVAAMKDEMPGVTLSLYEDDSGDVLLERLVAGDIDVTFFTDPVDDQRAEFIPLGVDPFMVLAPADVKLGKGAYPTRDLLGVPLIGQKESPYQSRIDDGLRGLGVSPRYTFRTNDNGGVQAMVRAGLGHAVMPRLAIDVHDPGIQVRPLAPSITPRTIYIALRRDGARLPAAERLVALARRTSRSHLMKMS